MAYFINEGKRVFKNLTKNKKKKLDRMGAISGSAEGR